jgi:hypothetical protein
VNDELDPPRFAVDWEATWAAWADPATVRRSTRLGSDAIRHSCRLLLRGRITAARALDEITQAARVSQPPREYRWEETTIWPIYRPFYSIAVRWWRAQQDGELTQELVSELEAEVIALATALVADE